MWGNNYGFQPGQGSGYPYSQAFGQSSTGQMPARQMMTPQIQDNPFNWVLGQGEAEAYPVSPGSTVILWDSKSNIIYIKSADNTGMPSMRRLKWEDYNESLPAAPDPNEYVTRKEFNELLARLGGGNAEVTNAEK